MFLYDAKNDGKHAKKDFLCRINSSFVKCEGEHFYSLNVYINIYFGGKNNDKISFERRLYKSVRQIIR